MMRPELTIGITGVSILAHDPAAAGFAAEAHLHSMLGLLGILGLALLAVRSKRWREDAGSFPLLASESTPLQPLAETEASDFAVPGSRTPLEPVESS